MAEASTSLLPIEPRDDCEVILITTWFLFVARFSFIETRLYKNKITEISFGD